MNKNKIKSLIGLATKARKVVSGEFSTEKAVRSGQAKLVVIAEDASDNTKKKFRNMALYINANSFQRVHNLSIRPLQFLGQLMHSYFCHAGLTPS